MENDRDRLRRIFHIHSVRGIVLHRLALVPGNFPSEAERMAVEQPAVISLQHLSSLIHSEASGIFMPVSPLQYSVYQKT